MSVSLLVKFDDGDIRMRSEKKIFDRAKTSCSPQILLNLACSVLSNTVPLLS